MAARGFFADLDGTLADSLSVLRGVYRGFMQRLGKPDSDAEFQGLNGPPIAEFVARLRVAHGLRESDAELARIYMELVDEAYKRVEPMPMALDVLAAAKQAGWVVGIVTSNGTQRTRAWLERTRLQPQVDLVISGDDVARGKPDPEPYRTALVRAGCEARHSIAVEDSPQGAAAARAAGVKTYLIRGQSGRRLSQQGVHAIGSLAALLPVLTAPVMPPEP
ncbi:MAG TPA: HAD family phosphatase, partial [Stellaceae bacterium]|nr:HAD family phosphatase [Stellaceae bacterium]